MVHWFLFIGAALAAPSANGFHRLHVDVEQTVWTPLEAHPRPTEDLGLHNPYTRTATVTVGGIEVGTLGPQTTATLTDVPAGVYEVRWSVAGRPAVQTQVETQHAD